MAYMVQYLSQSAGGRRYFVWIALAFLGGTFYGLQQHLSISAFPLLLWYSFGFLILLFLFFLILSLLLPGRTNLTGDLVLLWFFLFSFCLGIFRVHFFETRQFRTLQDTAGTPRQYIGVLRSDTSPSNSGKSLGFSVKVLSYEADGITHPCNGKVLLYAPPESAESLKHGDMISFRATLTPPSGAPYPGGFSMRDYLYRQGFCFSQYTKTLSPIENTYKPSLFDRLEDLGNRLQSNILASIDENFGEKSEESALLSGILLGVRDDFTPEQHRQFTDSGLIHITAVSGMHVMFLCNFLLFFLRKARLPKPFIDCLLVPILILFCAVAAFTPSVCRSVIMMLLFILSQLLQREPDSLTALAVAAVLLVAINPYTLSSYSFILSFSTTLGIILFTGPLQRLFLRLFRRFFPIKKDVPHGFRTKAEQSLFSSLSLSISSHLGMGFFAARFFGQFSLGSLFANLFLLPLASGSFILGALNWLLHFLVPSLTRFLTQILLQPMLWLINQIAAFFSQPIFRASIPKPPVSAILPYLVLCIAFYLALLPASAPPSDETDES